LRIVPSFIVFFLESTSSAARALADVAQLYWQCGVSANVRKPADDEVGKGAGFLGLRMKKPRIGGAPCIRLARQVARELCNANGFALPRPR
jgi:hypothetical protein